MRKTITLDLGETTELDQFLDEYVLDEMRGAINDLDLSETTIAYMQKLLDKTKRHFRSQIVEAEKTDAEPVRSGEWILWDGKYDSGYICSRCKRPAGVVEAAEIYKYCPFCGAKMQVRCK